MHAIDSDAVLSFFNYTQSEMHGVQEENKILFRILNNAWSMKIFIVLTLN